MKLVGSRQEEELRTELRKGRKALFEDGENGRLLAAIREEYPDSQTAYVLDWVPEQGEDIYCLLVDRNAVIWIELDRLNRAFPHKTLKKMDVGEYRTKLRKLEEIKLLVALELASADMLQTE